VKRHSRVTALLLIGFVLASIHSGEAQQQATVPKIGFLAGVSPSAITVRLEAFRRGLRELGYIEGKNIVIESRYAEEHLDRLPALASELVRLKVDVIITGGPPAIRSAKNATSTIPIVMGFDSDPVANGFVASLARPGGNITGLSALSPEISGKQLELLREIIPKLSRVSAIGSSSEPGNARTLKETELAARVFGLKLQTLDIRDASDFDTAFEAATKERSDAGLVLPSAYAFAERIRLVNLAAKNRLPVMYGSSEYVEAGGLMTYGVSFTDLFQRAAIYVDKILRGAKPAELPVEQPKKFELVINLKAAKQIGLTIPPNVLARADRVIR
jgi:putative tryptophan/tyrosine transport system substrate-binding protein